MNDLRTSSILLEGLRMPECLRWHDGRLFLSDMEAGTVIAVDLDGTSEVVATVEKTPAGLGWTPDGDLLIVSRHDRRLLRLTAGGLEPVADLGTVVGSDLNDMVVDGRGRAYVGDFGYDYLGGEAPTPGEIVLVADGKPRVVAEGLDFPNGMVITADGSSLIVAETFSGRIAQFRIADDGTLSDRTLFADLGERQPDGLCLDAEGAVWAGCPIQGEVCRVLPGGTITDRVVIGDRHCMSAELGGRDGRTLFIGTADLDFDPLDPTRPPARPSEGRIEAVEVDVPGPGLA
jgi:sugar lactone lactonase YvrE